MRGLPWGVNLKKGDRYAEEMYSQSCIKQGATGDSERVSEAVGRQRKRDIEVSADGLCERVKFDEGKYTSWQKSELKFLVYTYFFHYLVPIRCLQIKPNLN